MPNHCTNQVVLACPSEGVARATRKHLEGREGVFDFNTLVPEPPELLESTKDKVTLEELRAKHGHDNWYDWRIANWGTKWNAYGCELDDSQIKQGMLDYRFDTAWAPPHGVCGKLLDYIAGNNLGIQVDWFYYEPMLGLRGQLEEEF